MSQGVQFLIKTIRKHPLRLGLTLLQIAIGVALSTIVLSFIFSAAYNWQQTDQKKVLQVYVGSAWSDPLPLFTEQMIEYFQRESSFIADWTVVEESSKSIYQSAGLLQYDSIQYTYKNIIGVGVKYPVISGLKILEGNFVTKQDIKSQNPVILISQEVQQQLFGEKSGLGQMLQITPLNEPERRFEIIGIFLQEKQEPYRPTHLLIPYSVVQSADSQPGSYRELWFTCQSENLAEAKHEFSSLFFQEIKRLGVSLPEHTELIFNEPAEEKEKIQRSVVSSNGQLLGAFAFIALVITSVGILSIMMVSIVERTREIGLRRALGASQRSILGQILLESVLIAFSGGILGIPLATVLFKPMNALLELTYYHEYWVIESKILLLPVVISVSLVMLIGLIVGLYPGFLASRLNPVEAIRER